MSLLTRITERFFFLNYLEMIINFETEEIDTRIEFLHTTRISKRSQVGLYSISRAFESVAWPAR